MAYDPFALGVVQDYCGWDPTAVVTNGTVTLDGNGTTVAFLPSLYVTAVTAVTVTNPDGSTYTATIGPGMNDVGWSDDGVLEWQSCNNGACWPDMLQAVQVTYSGGYDPVPPDLDACLTKLGTRLSGTFGQTSQSVGGASIAYAQTVAAGGLLTVEQWVLDRYRIVRGNTR